MRKVRDSRIFKRLAVFVALNMLFQLGLPTVSFALTSGPAQEEFASFEPATTTDMVDLSSGDFTYNIPLMSVPGPNGGYPINLSYHSGVGMEQEASWVGLGWNINVGAVNRQLRGLPDDFNGDNIEYDYDYRENVTVGLDGPSNFYFKDEQFGLNVNSSNNFQWQIYYNTFKGMGYRVMLGNALPELLSKHNLGLGLSIDSQNGIGLSPSISSQSQNKDNLRSISGSLYANTNNREGLTDIGFSAKYQKSLGKSIKNVTNKTIKGAKSGIKAVSLGSSVSFATSHNVPQVSLPFNTTTSPFNISIGSAGSPHWWGEYSSFFPMGWSGYVNRTSLSNNGEVSADAYGYLYTQNGVFNAVKDFSRNQLQYSKKVPNLASSNYTYDLFTYTGQGAGGMFRPYRSTIDVLSDHYRSNTTSTKQINTEFGTKGINTHVGFGFPYEKSVSSSGIWTDGMDDVDIENLSDDNESYEYAYFQEYGEKTGYIQGNASNSKEDQLYNWKHDEAVRLDLEKSGGWIDRKFEVSNNYRTSSAASTFPVAPDEYSKNQINTSGTEERQRRSKVINKLTDKQASKYGFTKNLTYDKWDTQAQDYVSVGKTFYGNDHISEIEVIEPDGMRYIYGLPAYNNTQIDETMGTGAAKPAAVDNGLTPVGPNTNTTQNTSTSVEPLTQYRNKTTLPKYVHSWMLTAVVSADYVDRTGNGPTEDDLGYYTKFNYRKRYDNYKWRVPYNQGSFMEGTMAEDDNMVSYTYGEKEIYFLHSIETKTHKAIFNHSARKDAYDANGQYAAASTKGTQPMHKLNKIELFSKNEIDNNPISPTPIKTVHFTYNYDLCQGIPNNKSGTLDNNELSNNGGKLTLKKLYFTYENSSRGSLSPYEFSYGNSNKDYSRTEMDRWGNYKSKSSYGSNYPYELFPYNDQTTSPENAASWDLTKIELPTGGVMEIEYEEDNYSYVQDENPMKMFDIVSIDNTLTPFADKYSNGNNSDKLSGERIYFALHDPINPNINKYNINLNSSGNQNSFVKERFFNFSSMGKIWFKALIDLLDGTDDDYVMGYADIDYTKQFGLEDQDSDGNLDVGYFYVKKADIAKFTSGGIHPFQKAAFQHLQMQRSDLLYGAANPPGSGLSQILNFIPAIMQNIKDLGQMTVGFNNYCKLNNYGENIYFNGNSIVKLYDEDQIKQGGGSRVSKLTIDDNWESDNNGLTTENYLYGQEYNYSLANGLSSGVAYEPRIGGEESVLRKPVNYSESTFLSTTKNLFVEQPILENYYPGPSVVYSKVTVSSIAPELADSEDNSNDLLVTSAPITEYEFYTAKDFPIITDETDMSNDPDILRPLQVPGIYTNYKKRRARSQGYSIILNDMNGKPKAITQKTRPIYDSQGVLLSAGELISKEEYIYQTKTPYGSNKRNELHNVVKTLNENGTYTDAVIGQSHDIFIDMNENKMKSKSRTTEFNIDIQVVAPIPLISIVPVPYWGDVELSTKTVVTNKIIHRTGILKEIITTTNESVIKQENLAFDINTGAPLLTQVTNEYKDPIYNHKLPAHWYYEGMEGAYQNIGYTASGFTYTGNDIHVPDASLFHVGDEVGIQPSNERVYVVDVNDVANTIQLRRFCFLVDPGTTAINSITVLRSGHRNMLTTNVGNVTSKYWNFFQTAPTTLADLYKDGSNVIQVIDANAVEFKDEWQHNDFFPCKPCEGDANPYTNGLLGNWRAFKTHKYVGDRVYASANGNRTDGVYANFTQFDWMTSSNPLWVLANEVTRYSPYGFETENKDALGNFSSARYGYSASLNTAVAYNTMQMEVGTNNFEEPSGCTSHFEFLVSSPSEQPITPTLGEAHTGSYAVKLQNGESTYYVGDVVNSVTYPVTTTTDVHFIDGQEYIVSAWVKQNRATPNLQDISYVAPYIQVEMGTTPVAGSPFITSGNVIDGWQRIEARFTASNATSSTVKITLGALSSPIVSEVLFDDVRVYPANANMKTFVYDPISLKLAAELDANNYATFYIYDEQGQLSKIKRETEQGIKTISEGRLSNVK